MKTITKRLLPKQDLKKEIEKIVQENNVKAGSLLSIVGSLTNLRLRVADGKTVREWTDQFEIVSGARTLSTSKCHIHISASDQEGRVLGGHLKEGCVIGTTAEIVLQVFEGMEFTREPDPDTGYGELIVKKL